MKREEEIKVKNEEEKKEDNKEESEDYSDSMIYYDSWYIKDYLLVSQPVHIRIITECEETKEMFVYKVNSDDESITGLVLDYSATQVLVPATRWRKESYEYKYKDLPEWHYQTLKPEHMTIPDYSDPPIDFETTFIKYGRDREVEYGDGGYSYLHYPVYKANNLCLPQETKKLLVEKLEELGEIRQDWHAECPVLDIIDPDLAPNYYFCGQMRKNCPERSKYAWFPVDVMVYPDKSVKFLGPIHNLEEKGNEKLYNCISEVFKRMLDGFEKLDGFENLDLVPKEESRILQVVVKAQKYVIQPGTSYSGKWHLEGKTEDIVAAGVYYCKIDEGFENDVVVFRPKKAPAPFYTGGENSLVEVDVSVSENASLVFLNTIPHKFLKLTNLKDHPLERLFLNFFIVNPRNKLESTSLRFEAFNALRKISKLPKVLIDEILSFLFYCPHIREAKEKREITRESMKTDTSGWGYICYGNAGDVKFLEDYKEVRNIDDYSKFMDASIEKIYEV